LVAFKGEPGQIVVLFLVQHVFTEGYAGSQDLCYAAAHEFGFCEGRVFKLVAYGYLVACPDEFLQVGVDGVVRESCHLDAPLVAV